MIALTKKDHWFHHNRASGGEMAEGAQLVPFRRSGSIGRARMRQSVLRLYEIDWVSNNPMRNPRWDMRPSSVSAACWVKHKRARTRRVSLELVIRRRLPHVFKVKRRCKVPKVRWTTPSQTGSQKFDLIAFLNSGSRPPQRLKWCSHDNGFVCFMGGRLDIYILDVNNHTYTRLPPFYQSRGNETMRNRIKLCTVQIAHFPTRRALMVYVAWAVMSSSGNGTHGPPRLSVYSTDSTTWKLKTVVPTSPILQRECPNWAYEFVAWGGYILAPKRYGTEVLVVDSNSGRAVYDWSIPTFANGWGRVVPSPPSRLLLPHAHGHSLVVVTSLGMGIMIVGVGAWLPIPDPPECLILELVSRCRHPETSNWNTLILDSIQSAGDLLFFSFSDAHHSYLGHLVFDSGDPAWALLVGKRGMKFVQVHHGFN